MASAGGPVRPPANAAPALDVRLRKRLSAEFTLEVAFHAGPGVTILFGPSGCGKTTLLNCIAGLLTPDEGRVAMGDEQLYDSGAAVDVPSRARRVGYVFQELALFPHMTATQNVRFGLFAKPASEQGRRAHEMLEAFDAAGVARRRADGLSGGEKQRVALARTLAPRPQLVLLDEPLSALDLATRTAIVGDLKRRPEVQSVPTLYVTHSYDEAMALGHTLIAMSAGKIVEVTTPERFFNSEGFRHLL
ncbi:MAG TPA: ATP-binding cassette domain-containing protein [Terriglobales bacterium]|nr:ATP-binding cassette domain-containing protein [Terriglobales bacterium]